MVVHVDVLRDERAVGCWFVVLHEVDLDNVRETHFEALSFHRDKSASSSFDDQLGTYQSGLKSTGSPISNTYSQKATRVLPQTSVHPDDGRCAPASLLRPPHGCRSRSRS